MARHSRRLCRLRRPERDPAGQHRHARVSDHAHRARRNDLRRGPWRLRGREDLLHGRRRLRLPLPLRHRRRLVRHLVQLGARAPRCHDHPPWRRHPAARAARAPLLAEGRLLVGQREGRRRDPGSSPHLHGPGLPAVVRQLGRDAGVHRRVPERLRHPGQFRHPDARRRRQLARQRHLVHTRRRRRDTGLERRVPLARHLVIDRDGVLRSTATRGYGLEHRLRADPDDLGLGLDRRQAARLRLLRRREAPSGRGAGEAPREEAARAAGSEQA